MDKKELYFFLSFSFFTPFSLSLSFFLLFFPAIIHDTLAIP